MRSKADSGYAKFQFRATNQWIEGGLTRSRIKDFFASNAEDKTREQAFVLDAEDKTREQAFVLDADEPTIVAGQDSAPTPVEYVLHALAGCLTTTLVYHAAVRGIRIEAVESSYMGEIDVRGMLGRADDVRKAPNKVRVNMCVKSKADAEELTELAMYSPVYDMVSQSLPVEFTLTTY